MADPPELAEDVELDLERRRYILETYAQLSTFTHYDLLGVRKDADRRTIKTAFFRLSGLVHPDRYFGKRLGSYKPKLEELFLRMTTAHDTLSSPAERKKYDAALAAHLEKHGAPEPKKGPTGPVDPRVVAFRRAARDAAKKLDASGWAFAKEYAAAAIRARAANDVVAAAAAYRSAVTFAPRDPALLSAQAAVRKETTAKVDEADLQMEQVEERFGIWAQAADHEHLEIAVMALDEDPRGVAAAFPGLCLLAKEEERRAGAALQARLSAVWVVLPTDCRSQILVGFPTLVGQFREAVLWTLDGLPEATLARAVLECFCAHSGDVAVVLYALSVAVPHDGRRHSVLRRVALRFYDLPIEDPACSALLTALARPGDEGDPHRRDRGCLSAHAARALAVRAKFPLMPGGAPEVAALTPFDARRVTTDIVKIAAQTTQFERLCAKLPSASATLLGAGATDAVFGILQGLHGVPSPIAKNTLPQVGSPALGAQLLYEAITASEADEGSGADAATAFLARALDVKLLTALWPTAAWEQFERIESGKLRPILFEAMAQAGPGMLPFVCTKFSSPTWSVVRDAVLLFQRLGGQSRELVPLAAHPHDQVRLEVLRAVRGMRPDEATMDIVAPYLIGGSEETRTMARQMLRGDVLGPNGAAALEIIAADEQQPKEVRTLVIETLGRSPHDAAATALFKLLQPRGLLDLGSVRDEAAWALRRSKAPQAATLFQEGLRSAAWRVRKACERAASGGA